MRALVLNPTKFDVELRCMEATRETKDDDGQMTVDFRFGETTGLQVFLKSDMEKIGRWFLAAAKRVAKP